MKQILQIFTAIVVLTNITQASSFKDAFEAHMRLAKENLIPNVGPDGSTTETSRVTWRDEREPVDLGSFFSRSRSRLYTGTIASNRDEVLTRTANPGITNRRVVKTGVGRFVNMYYPQGTQKKAVAQPTTVQSSRNAQNATVTAPATQQNKHNLDQSSMLTFVTNKRMKGDPASDSEGSTDRESLTRSDSLTISLPSTSNSVASDILSEEEEEDNAL